MFEKFNSKFLDIELHPINSLNYILQYSLIYEEFNLYLMINNELKRRIKFNICEHKNVLRCKETKKVYWNGDICYCKDCNKQLMFVRNRITKFSGNLKEFN